MQGFIQGESLIPLSSALIFTFCAARTAYTKHLLLALQILCEIGYIGMEKSSVNMTSTSATAEEESRKEEHRIRYLFLLDLHSLPFLVKLRF